MTINRLHHIDSYQTIVTSNLFGGLYLAIQRLVVGIIDNFTFFDAVSSLHQIRMVNTQVDAGNGTNGPLFGNGPGQLVS